MNLSLCRAFIVATLIALCGISTPASAATEQPVVKVAERPKIGLVISGGGARGAAHVGVIRFLEEQNISIDYVAGTSMGAIVGSLYLGADTFFGPVFLAYGHAEDGRDSVYLLVGQPF
jgi:hypothetical protein